MSAPVRATMVYDGDCGFCRRTAARWKKRFDRQIDFISFDECLLPEAKTKEFRSMVRFVSQMGQFMVELLRSPKCSHSLAIMFGTGCINYRSSISSRIWDITLSRRIEDLLEGFSDFRPAVGAESSSA
jgi:hypothetical protein